MDQRREVLKMEVVNVSEGRLFHHDTHYPHIGDSSTYPTGLGFQLLGLCSGEGQGIACPNMALITSSKPSAPILPSSCKDNKHEVLSLRNSLHYDTDEGINHSSTNP